MVENIEGAIDIKYLDIRSFFYDISLCISESEHLDTEIVSKILSKEEFERYCSFKSNKTKLHYVLGRHSAKRAFLQCTKQCLSLNEINIKNGIFGQPVLCNERFDVSIAHSGNCGAGVVFDRKYPTGVDIEMIDFSKKDALEVMTKQSEIFENSVLNLVAAWSFKEALSKVLRCGLTVPFQLLQIENFQKNDAEITCNFVNFPQYKGISKIFNDKVFSIVFPKIIDK